jgi:signal transduction histidine kinase
MQVLLNLLSNAARSVPKNTGRVDVDLLREANGYLVRVADNGKGIRPEELERIFEKFRQGSGGHEKPVGTGLGLPISRRIIQHLGGRIWVESTLGSGATFSFFLPKR